MSERDDLVAMGFVDDGSGALRIYASVSLTPIDNHFFRLVLALPHGSELSCVIPQIALKLAPPTELVIDPEAMITNTVRRDRGDTHRRSLSRDFGQCTAYSL